MRTRIHINKEYLLEHYVKQQKSTKDIGQQLNIPATKVAYWIKKYKIPNRIWQRVVISKKITHKTLHKLYIKDKNSCEEIGRKFGLTKDQILRLLKKFNIPRRTGYSPSKLRDEKYNSMNTGYGEIGGWFWGFIKRGARQRRIDFSIDIKYAWELFLKQEGKCALSGEPISLVFSRRDVSNHKKEQTASLDRIDSSKGYIQGNVQWVHKYINWMKLDWNNVEFVNLCKQVINFREDLLRDNDYNVFKK